jgi:hypothetical protein
MPGYWNAHSDLDWYTGSAAHEAPPEPDEAEEAAVRQELLEEAADLLKRSLRHERWGCSAQDYAAQAVPLLRAAGRGELADRLEEDAWGSDTASVLVACYRALERREEG